ncbi:MAG: aminotransferase class I/II-fold pyridoxal phosphate-dependent enzyme [Chitinophagaceae bacterium]|nr:aminotransferase class I/II-fold pyridoxal phosphate-dependent enzyme [Oligoflexus sp.]
MQTSRWQKFETSIFSKMSQLAQTHQAVNLAQGFPDFDGPQAIKDAAIQAIRGDKNQYAPAYGVLELRKALAERQKDSYSLDYNPQDEVTVFSGATEAIFCTIVGLCQAGDEIISFEPFYDSYPAAAMLSGAVMKTVALKAPNWTFDIEDLKAQITPKTKLLLLNTPNNPTGKVFSRKELLAIAQLAKDHNFFVMTDEVYEELIYSPARHMPIATVPGMKDRTILVSSTSKTFSMTGWKIGYAFAPAFLTKAIRIPHQYTVFCSATPLQYGMIAALKLSYDYYHVLREEYSERRAALFKLLVEMGFECHLPEGTYFIVANHKNLLDIPDTEFAVWLTKVVGVACIPVSSFYADPEVAAKTSRYVRFGFCKDIATIEAAGAKFRANLKNGLNSYHHE